MKNGYWMWGRWIMDCYYHAWYIVFHKGPRVKFEFHQRIFYLGIFSFYLQERERKRDRRMNRQRYREQIRTMDEERYSCKVYKFITILGVVTLLILFVSVVIWRKSRTDPSLTGRIEWAAVPRADGGAESWIPVNELKMYFLDSSSKSNPSRIWREGEYKFSVG